MTLPPQVVNSGPLTNPFLTGSQGQTGSSISLGWRHRREQMDFSLNYSGSYNAFLNHPELNSLNHIASFSGHGIRLSRKLQLAFSGSAVISDFDALQFTPTAYRELTGLPAGAGEFGVAPSAFRSANDQLASLLTGTPLIPMAESPGRPFLHGNRSLAAAVGATLSYAPSSRLAFTYQMGAVRAQYLRGKGEPEDPNLLLGNTMGSVSLGGSYFLTRRTQIGGDFSLSRTFSTSFQDKYIGTWMTSVNRDLGKRWFLQARGGVGFTKLAADAAYPSEPPRVLYGAGIGYRTFTHTFAAFYDRTLLDAALFSTGETYSMSTASWTWSRPGRRWSVQSNFGFNVQTSSGFPHIHTWLATVGLAQALTSQLSVRAQYGVGELGSKRFVRSGIGYQLSHSAVHLALIWTPQVRPLR